MNKQNKLPVKSTNYTILSIRTNLPSEITTWKQDLYPAPVKNDRAVTASKKGELTGMVILF